MGSRTSVMELAAQYVVFLRMRVDAAALDAEFARRKEEVFSEAAKHIIAQEQRQQQQQQQQGDVEMTTDNFPYEN